MAVDSNKNSAGAKATIPGLSEYDAAITVTFLENDMKAAADFMPATGQGRNFKPDYIKMLLSRLNIVHGILAEVIEKTALGVNISKRPAKGVLIAKGDDPVNAVPAHFVMNPHLNESKDEKNVKQPGAVPNKNERIDYRKLSAFKIVKKNSVLAIFQKAKAGAPGKNVHGIETPFATEKVDSVQAGANTHSDDRFIYSDIDGQLIQTGNVVSVNEKLIIQGDVNFNTGNIDFPGDVEISGTVGDGFSIHTGGNLVVKQTFGATDVISRKDITVQGGILGRGQAAVKASGNFEAKFVENIRLAVKGNVKIASEILNSSIYSMGKVTVSSKGFLMGVDIYAAHGLTCGKIGKTSGKPSKIHAGIDFTVQKQIEKTSDLLRTLSGKMEQVKSLLRDVDRQSERYKQLLDTGRKLELEIRKATAIIETLRMRVNIDQDATIEVIDEVSAGTLIEICQVALYLDQPLRRTRFKLDRIQGRIVPSGL